VQLRASDVPKIVRVSGLIMEFASYHEGSAGMPFHRVAHLISPPASTPTEQNASTTTDNQSTADAPSASPEETTPTRSVPNLTGLSQSGASARAQRRGLAVEVVLAHSVRTAAGVVARRHPAAGQRVIEGDTVR
jgi:hypothetical protein